MLGYSIGVRTRHVRVDAVSVLDHAETLWQISSRTVIEQTLESTRGPGCRMLQNDCLLPHVFHAWLLSAMSQPQWSVGEASCRVKFPSLLFSNVAGILSVDA